jgi:hypothetical protein
MSRNLRRLKESLKSEECKFCYIQLFNNCVIVHDMDTNQYYARCAYCDTVYNHEFGIEILGIPDLIGIS